MQSLRLSAIIVSSGQPTAHETLSPEGENSLKQPSRDNVTQEAGSSLVFCIFTLVSSSPPSTGAAHGRRESRELLDGPGQNRVSFLI